MVLAIESKNGWMVDSLEGEGGDGSTFDLIEGDSTLDWMELEVRWRII